MIINNNQSKTLMEQKNAKFCFKGMEKAMKQLIIKDGKFMIQREPEDKIIF